MVLLTIGSVEIFMPNALFNADEISSMSTSNAPSTFTPVISFLSARTDIFETISWDNSSAGLSIISFIIANPDATLLSLFKNSMFSSFKISLAFIITVELISSFSNPLKLTSMRFIAPKITSVSLSPPEKSISPSNLWADPRLFAYGSTTCSYVP